VSSSAATCIFGQTTYLLIETAILFVRPGGWIGIVHWANPEGANIFSTLSRALKKLPLPTVYRTYPSLRRSCRSINFEPLCKLESAIIS
jgi:hypothetical protein